MRYLILFVTLIVSSCETYAPPKSELCGVTKYKDFQCNDSRVEPQDYDRVIRIGDVCTNPGDFKAMRFYCIDLRERLIKCERKNK